ncbi:guanylate kinase [sulfur-oxidizing endosymbiont of Gigantopelta aegis]|uniref:guanylate kinase n=1 Tax=sulfur-oxidizing endosymbiont of Gigantopelta aegis TaxID=2794934 RepID=UPI001FE5D1BA|nr:guanylate kinase [sulfur-oxidizing endosymbiont of Gigantopelta aegis]
MLYIISAPSGAGKTSLLKALLEETDLIEVSVSYTTREKRPGEREGIDYHYVSHETFQQMIAEQQFIEHAEVFGNFYGTSKKQIKEKLTAGIDIILEIDWQGAQQVRKQFDTCTNVFILPPSRQELLSRLTERGQDSHEVISKRMNEAIEQMSHYDEFEYLIVNDQFSHALGELKALIYAFRLRQSPQCRRHHNLIEALLV